MSEGGAALGYTEGQGAHIRLLGAIEGTALPAFTQPYWKVVAGVFPRHASVGIVCIAYKEGLSGLDNTPGLQLN